MLAPQACPRNLILFSRYPPEDHPSILSILLVQIYDISFDILGIPLGTVDGVATSEHASFRIERFWHFVSPALRIHGGIAHITTVFWIAFFGF